MAADDTEGKAEEAKERDRKDEQMEARNGKREVEEGRKRVVIDGKWVCFGFSSDLIPQKEGAKVAMFRESGDGVSDGELADCAFVSVVRSDLVPVSDSVDLSACVCDLTASLVSESEILSVSSQTFQILCGVPQTLSFSEKRAASAPCCINNPNEQE